MFVEPLAVIGAAASVVLATKVITNQTYDGAIGTLKGWLKENIFPYQPFSLIGVSGFWSGLESIVKSYSTLPMELTTTFEGTTGEFEFFKIQITANDTNRAIFEKALENLVIKALTMAGKEPIRVYVFSDIRSNITGETIVTAYYAVDASRVESLVKWYQKQIDLKKKALLTPPDSDEGLEKDYNDNDC